MSAAVVLGVYLALLGAGVVLDALWQPAGWLLVVIGVLLVGWGWRGRGADAP